MQIMIITQLLKKPLYRHQRHILASGPLLWGSTQVMNVKQHSEHFGLVFLSCSIDYNFIGLQLIITFPFLANQFKKSLASLDEMEQNISEDSHEINIKSFTWKLLFLLLLPASIDISILQ